MSIVISQAAAEFKPVTITIDDPTTLADLVGALGAYGKGVVKAKKTIRQAGMLEHYSGNARKTARTIVKALSEKVGFPMPDFGTGVTARTNDDLIGNEDKLDAENY